MKNQIIKLGTAVAVALITFTSFSQTEVLEPELANESNVVLQQMLDESPNLETLYDQSYGYVVFPKVTKAGMGLGGAVSNGVVFQNHEIVSTSKLKQLTIGAQFGGQQYSEVIFFETKEAFDKFMNDELKLGAQASAVALKSGVSADASYADGVAVFTQPIGGLMYEASIGGQHFRNSPIIAESNAN
ncbi:MAG: lipid-binding SYLF domain-containing protein [Crocinitomicaceae bacterium]|nr:lipid-binding SYLF domain-containing protein [Crocinitomicaceae bacterium]